MHDNTKITCRLPTIDTNIIAIYKLFFLTCQLFVTYFHQMESVFKAISDPTRREILEDLSKEPLAVHEIARRYLVSRPAISRHLSIMREAGLIDCRRSGKENVYFIDTKPLTELRDWLDCFWTSKIGTLKELSERIST